MESIICCCCRLWPSSVTLAAGTGQPQYRYSAEEEQRFVSKFERGERRLDILELRHICQAIGIPLDEFALRLEQALGEHPR